MMSNTKQGTYSIMEKVGDPYRNNSTRRTAYYTEISFCIKGREVVLTAKVDTGASHTVIGLGNKKIKPFTKYIQQQNILGDGFDASIEKLN